MPEVNNGYSLSHVYKYYKEKFYPKGEQYKISKKAFRDLCCDFNKMLIEDAFEGRIIKLPHSMGIIRVKKYEITYSKLRVDIKKTKETGQTQYFLKIPPDGYLAKWVWSKLRCKTTNITYYSFEPTWTNSRRLREFIKKVGSHKKFMS